MKHAIIGLLIGILFAFAPVFSAETGFALLPLWNASINNIQAVEQTPLKMSDATFAITTLNGYYQVSAYGSVRRFVAGGESIIKPTTDGNFYVSYKRVGNEIIMSNADNEIFWKLPSAEYPYISPDGKNIILLTADGSTARIADFNGNVYANPALNGQFCTAVGFSEKGSFAGIGFIDGRYFIVNNKGQIINQGTSPDTTLIKGIAIDDTGNYAIVHSGNSRKDYLLNISIPKKKTWQHELTTCHQVKTAMAINSKGQALFLDMDTILHIDIPSRDVIAHSVIKKRYGQSQVSVHDDTFSITYPAADGGTVWYIWQWDKGKIYSRIFFEEPFLHNMMTSNIILLRGHDTLLCFAYQP